MTADHEAALGLSWFGLSGAVPLGRLLRERSPSEIWGASAGRLASWGLNRESASVLIERRKCFELHEVQVHLRQSGQRFIPYGGSLYPKELSHLQCPPLGLFVRGCDDALRRMQAAPRMTVVGTRAASPEGLRAAEWFVRALVERGVAVISGMALGIDGQAHRTALSGDGLTAAVLGCGVDIAYPPRNRSLCEAVASSGVVMSELPPGTRPTRWAFPHRNRLLAALGDAVLVVEGAITSGALQTAKCALDIGRQVFSVPGSIFKDVSRGCNALLVDGAVPAVEPQTTVEDFLELTRIERAGRRAVDDARLAVREQSRAVALDDTDGRRGLVLRVLGEGPAEFDRLLSRTELSPRALGAALGDLESAGLVVRGGPGIYLRAP